MSETPDYAAILKISNTFAGGGHSRVFVFFRVLPAAPGGLTGAPVVAVPTSVGYGSSLEGVTALLGMLASCASGLTVVGIDNGFGAACAVLRMLGAASDRSGAVAATTETGASA